jgi:hypothetical protein
MYTGYAFEGVGCGVPEFSYSLSDALSAEDGVYGEVCFLRMAWLFGNSPGAPEKSKRPNDLSLCIIA